jgi:hypothetical protein
MCKYHDQKESIKNQVGAPLKYGVPMEYKKAYLPVNLWHWISQQGKNKTDWLILICQKAGWTPPKEFKN